MRSACAAVLLCLLAAVAWQHRQDPAVQAWWASWRPSPPHRSQASADNAVVVAEPCGAALTRCLPPPSTPSTAEPRRGAAPIATLVRKCVNGSSVLYTDEHCPHGHQSMALTGGTFNVVSGRSATEPADDADGHPTMSGLPQRVMQLAARF